MVAPTFDLSMIFDFNANPEDVTFEKEAPRVEDGDTGRLLAAVTTSKPIKVIRGAKGRGSGPQENYVDQGTGRSGQEQVVFWCKELDFTLAAPVVVPNQGDFLTDATGRKYRLHNVEFDRFSQIYEFDTRKVEP